MTDQTASRTLVKSAPELWAECSDPASLARHLGAFGEIRITKLEPESAVAWEGEAARGTVHLEPSGWGTRVTLTMTEENDAVAGTEPPVAVAVAEPVAEPEPEAMPEPEPEPEPVADEPAVVAPRPGRLARWMLRFRRGAAQDLPADDAPAPADEPGLEEPAPDPASAPVPVPAPAAPRTETGAGPAPSPGEEALTAALDSLGRAHHRPYSRA